MLALSVVVFALCGGACVESLFGSLKILWLRDFPSRDLPCFPSVSVIIAARNEEKYLAEALSSVLNLDYPNKEILVVNDRSGDGTGKILERLSAEHSEIRVVNVSTLPPGWMGKNHALQKGTEATDSDFLLFTDADVVFKKDTLKKAMAFVEERNLDHLAVLPEVKVPGVLLNLCVGIFGVYFGITYKPWKVTDPKSKRFVGVGGFNLLRRHSFQGVGGLSKISLRPDDDVQLGRLIKQAGYRQELAWGVGTCFVEWYSSVYEMMRGLEKNMFSGFNYSLIHAIIGLVGVFVLNIFPAIGLMVSQGAEQFFWGATWAVLALSYAFSAHRTGQSPFLGIFFPLGGLIHLVIISNAIIKTHLQKGVYWRDTFYSLDELRSQKN